MSDYPRFTINSRLDSSDICGILRDEMPDFTWRMGDSDAVGKYVSGRDAEQVSIKIWTSDGPYRAAISYSIASIDEATWPQITQRFLDIVSTRIGEPAPIN